jgi:hypothetical protein
MLDFAEARGCVTQMGKGRFDGISSGFEDGYIVSANTVMTEIHVAVQAQFLYFRY